MKHSASSCLSDARGFGRVATSLCCTHQVEEICNYGFGTGGFNFKADVAVAVNDFRETREATQLVLIACAECLPEYLGCRCKL